MMQKNYYMKWTYKKCYSEDSWNETTVKTATKGKKWN
jgi:hypothetical protein